MRGFAVVLFLALAGGAVAGPLTFGGMDPSAAGAQNPLLVPPVDADAAGAGQVRVSPLLTGTDPEPFTSFQTTTGQSALGVTGKPVDILAEFGAGFSGSAGARLPD